MSAVFKFYNLKKKNMKRISILSTLLGCSFCTLIATAEESYIAPLAEKSLLLDITQTQTDLISVGERGHILRSSDGENWVQEQAPILSTLTAVTSSQGQSWAVGHDAVILHQAGIGQPWSIQKFAPELERPLLDVHFIDVNEGIAIGAYGTYFKTSDGGKTWRKVMHAQLLHPDDILYLEEIRLEDEEFYQSELGSILPHLNRITEIDGILYIAGESGLIAQSFDKGETWQRMDVPYFGSFFDIRALEDGSVVAAGLRGNIFILKDQDAEWQSIDSGVTSSLNSIIPLVGNDFLAMGNSGYIICVNGAEVRKVHLDDGKALNAGLLDNDSLVIASAVGMKQLAFSQQQSICERTK
jgi:photosystem II stability/assembly factor-like uncharacterized protein